MSDIQLKVAGLLYALLIVFVTYVLRIYYTEADAKVYNDFYESVREFDFVSGYEFYRNSIGSIEPMYYVLVFFSTNYIDREVFVLFANFVLSYFYFQAVYSLRLSFASKLLILFNYYFFVLLVPAERLKFSVMWFMIALHNIRHPLVFVVISVLSHTQMLFVGYVYGYYKYFNASFLHGRWRKFSFILGSVVFIYFLNSYFGEGVTSKLSEYTSVASSFEGILKPLAFFVICLLFIELKQKYNIIAVFVPLVVASFFVGSDRLTIFAFALLVFFFGRYENKSELPVFLILLYFVYKSYLFFDAAIINGHSFN